MNLYIARDKDGSLFLYSDEPYLNNDTFWVSGSNGTIRLRNDSFPKITFENSPQEVELKLINEL